MKESGEGRLKCAVYESTRAPLARSLPVSSFRAKARNLFRLRLSRRCGDSGIPDTKPSPRGEGAPKGRIGQERYEKERRRSSQVRRLRKYPIHRWRGPPSPMGKAKRRRLRRKKKANPASLRPSPPPREGARTDTPSFLWKEVPRRGGG